MPIFSSPTEDETTAFFTFYNDTTTKAVRHNGPMTIIEREGTIHVSNVMAADKFEARASKRSPQPANA